MTIIFQCSKIYGNLTSVTRLKFAPNMAIPISPGKESNLWFEFIYSKASCLPEWLGRLNSAATDMQCLRHYIMVREALTFYILDPSDN